ncbi:MAG: glycoside hydrolase family 99-like domain-containing protein [Candidatus Omnitrophica bacterium]|nr:glycoside hydrolase family 99-like domain-containing protein [Candidatus Omnitrophota bacterium]
MKIWVPNSHLGDVRVEKGVVEFDATGSDPYLHCRNLSIQASPTQFVLIRLRANRPGNGDLFWSGETEGKYGGLTEAKKTTFRVRGDDSWEEIPILPFWQTEGRIRQLRLDVYEGAHFAIDSIEIRDWGRGPSPPDSTWNWDFDGDLSSWQIHPNSDLFMTAFDRGSTDGHDWATVRMRSDIEGVAAVVWATDRKSGLQTQEFDIQGDGKIRSYPVRLNGLPNWRGSILAFGLRLPSASPERVFVESVEVGPRPIGPSELKVSYLGFEDCPNRTEAPCRVLAHLTNVGAETATLENLEFRAPEEVQVLSQPRVEENSRVGFEQTIPIGWEVQAMKPGKYPMSLIVQSNGDPIRTTATLSFTPSLHLPHSEMVPKPHPIETSLHVCAYYFPGWNTPEKWDCIRETAPIRKPMLGYYDEGNPECVDWQIKWAVENGIACFLVDWYWIQGKQHLTHWFDAYRQARYRDQLQVAIMWANHNPPGTHSREDWREVTKHWIEAYLPLPTYYQVNGRPAVFLWDPRLIRDDLGGSEDVRAAFEESQQMARDAGFPGIEFIAMHDHDSQSQAERLLAEGYSGATNYHEWGEAPELAESSTRMEYEDVVRTASGTWRERDRECGDLTYYPVVDTGWDARPWHGKKAQVIRNRTADGFERLLAQAKSYSEEHGKPFVVLGPVNEWGEGSYIEPCVEFEFDMLERIRKVFGIPEPSGWPVNIGPSDVGLGPYDFTK